MPRGRHATPYDQIGHGYRHFRSPDPRIGAVIHRGIGAAPSLLNVGAGVGS